MTGTSRHECDPQVVALLDFAAAEPGPVLPTFETLSEQDLSLFAEWECAAAPRGVHKFLSSGMEIRSDAGRNVLAFTDEICQRTPYRDLLLRKEDIRDGIVKATLKPIDELCPPTIDRSDCREALVGVIFRMQTVRHYYQFAIEGRRRAVLSRRDHDEWYVLAQHRVAPVDDYVTLQVEMSGDAIRCTCVELDIAFFLSDRRYSSGRVGVRSLKRSFVASVEVRQSEQQRRRDADRTARERRRRTSAGSGIAEAVPYSSLDLRELGGTPSFSDFARPGHHDLLVVGQETLSAVTSSGRPLWTFPEAVGHVLFSRRHLHGDGRLIYAITGLKQPIPHSFHGHVAYSESRGTEIVVLRGADGSLVARRKLPESPSARPTALAFGQFSAALTSSEGTDFVIRDNRNDIRSGGGTTVWAFDKELNLLWSNDQDTSRAWYGHKHAVAACDVDGDGYDEILAGGILYDRQGGRLWQHDLGEEVASWPYGGDHYDEVTIGYFAGDACDDPVAFFAASSAGVYVVDARTGSTRAVHRIGHAQYAVPVQVRPDLGYRQVMVGNHHGSNGVLSLFSGRGEYLWYTQPTFVVQRPCPVQWPGSEADLIWINATGEDQAFLDGYGRSVKQLRWISRLYEDRLRYDLSPEVVRLGTLKQDLLAITVDEVVHLFAPEST